MPKIRYSAKENKRVGTHSYYAQAIPTGKLVEETARNSDWKMMNGHHYCPSCWERDDDDTIHTKDGRKWDDSSVEVVEVREDIKN